MAEITKVKTANHEEWKDIPGFEGLYQVSDIGNVKSLDRTEIVKMRNKAPFVRKRIGKNLKQYIDRYGYMKVVLLKNGKPNFFTVHRLVALAFVENPEHKSTVDHIDCNKKNNHASNLRWFTPNENLFHSHELGRQYINATPVVATSPTGEVFKFRSQKYAAKITGVGQWAITRALHGKKQDLKGWCFDYDHESKNKQQTRMA